MVRYLTESAAPIQSRRACCHSIFLPSCVTMRLASVLFIATAAATLALDDPTLASVKIGNILYSGTGCETVKDRVQGNSVTMIFDTFYAFINPPNMIENGTKYCYIGISTFLPSGWRLVPSALKTQIWLSEVEGTQLDFSTSVSVTGIAPNVCERLRWRFLSVVISRRS